MTADELDALALTQLPAIMGELLAKDHYPKAATRQFNPQARRRRHRFTVEGADGSWIEAHSQQHGVGATALIAHIIEAPPARAAEVLAIVIERLTAHKRPMTPTVIKNYTELRRVLDQRRKQFGYTLLDIDYASGVQEGYSSKIVAGIKSMGDVSLPCLFQALHLEMIIRPLETATTKETA